MRSLPRLALAALLALTAACGGKATRPNLSPEDQQLLAASIGPDPVAAPQPPLLAPAGLAGPTAALPGSADEDIHAAAGLARPVHEQLAGKQHRLVRDVQAFAGSTEARALAAEPVVARTVALVRQAAARQLGVTPSRRAHDIRGALKTIQLSAIADAHAGRGREAAYSLIALAWLTRGPLGGAPLLDALLGGVATRRGALETLADLVAAGLVSRADLQALEPALAQVLDLPIDHAAMLRADARQRRLAVLAAFGQGIAATTARAALGQDAERAETWLCGGGGCGGRVPSARGLLAEAAALEAVSRDLSPRGRARALLGCWLAPGADDQLCLGIADVGHSLERQLAGRERELRTTLASAR